MLSHHDLLGPFPAATPQRAQAPDESQPAKEERPGAEDALDPSEVFRQVVSARPVRRDRQRHRLVALEGLSEPDEEQGHGPPDRRGDP